MTSTPSPQTQPSESAPASALAKDDILTLQDVHVRYGSVPALRGISLKLVRGEMTGVVGPNGAGKSTMMLAIAGAVKIAQGVIRLDGRPLNDEMPEDIARSGVSLVPERRHIFVRLTVEENLRIAGTAQGKRDIVDQLQQVYDRLPVLGERRESLAGDLSGGQQQQLAIARALMTRPRLLLIDEPSLGLAPMMAERVFDMLAELRKDNISVLMVEQNALAAIEMCDQIYVLQGGQVKLEGDGKDPSTRNRLVQGYIEQLGLEAELSSESSAASDLTQ